MMEKKTLEPIVNKNGDEKMRLLAYAKLLNKKVNSAHKKAKNPFLDWDDSLNPFKRKIYNTLVWIEESDKKQTDRYK